MVPNQAATRSASRPPQRTAERTCPADLSEKCLRRARLERFIHQRPKHERSSAPNATTCTVDDARSDSAPVAQKQPLGNLKDSRLSANDTGASRCGPNRTNVRLPDDACHYRSNRRHRNHCRQARSQTATGKVHPVMPCRQPGAPSSSADTTISMPMCARCWLPAPALTTTPFEHCSGRCMRPPAVRVGLSPGGTVGAVIAAWPEFGHGLRPVLALFFEARHNDALERLWNRQL
jgi:hypothetical protein